MSNHMTAHWHGDKFEAKGTADGFRWSVVSVDTPNGIRYQYKVKHAEGITVGQCGTRMMALAEVERIMKCSTNL